MTQKECADSRGGNSEQTLEMPSATVRKKGRSQQKGPGRSTGEQAGTTGSVDLSRMGEAASQQEGAADCEGC